MKYLMGRKSISPPSLLTGEEGRGVRFAAASLRHLLRLVLLLPLLLFLPLSSVSAHAMLDSSTPDGNASLPAGPPQVELMFSEAVEPGLSYIKVLDSNGNQVDLQDVRVDPNNPARLTVSLGSLPDGVYTVTWKAVSAADGHLTGGTYPFAVGNVDAAALASAKTTSTTDLPFGAVASKWLFYLALAVLAGRTSFLWLVWRPAARAASNESCLPEPPAWRRLAQIGLLVLFLALGWGLLSQAGQAAGKDVATAMGLAAPWSTEAGDLLAGSRLGLLWLIRLALSLILAWLLLGGEARAPSLTGAAWRDWASLAACLGLLLTASLTSHAAAEAAPLVPVLADFVHLMAVSAWAGGLAWFVLGVRAVRRLPPGQQTGLVSALVLRFSALAAVGVGLVMVTGVYTSLLRVGSLADLTGTLYGKALLVKVALALLLMLLGAVNLLGISPRLRRAVARGEGDLALVGRFHRIVSTELILSAVVLLSASLLTSLPPARMAQSGDGLTASASVDDLQLHLNITPGRVGTNTFVLQVMKGGQPVTAVNEALLRMAPRKAGLPPTEAQLIAQGDGTYLASGSYLSLPDTWQVQAIVRRDQQYDVYAIFQFNLQNPASPGQAQAESTRIAGGLAALCGLASGLALFGLLPVRRAVPRLAAGVIPALALLALGAILLFKTPAPAGEELNPVSPSSQSIAAGQAIYTARCSACHGTSGKGDGPIGQTLIPRPADLTQHAVPGIHTDFQLYQWISDGIGGRMPAFRGVLSPTDRWNLVNFIRTFAPK